MVLARPTGRSNADLGPQRPCRRHLARRRGRAVGDRLEVERVDVPGVERRRVVVVDLEDVPGRGERLAPGAQLDQRADQAVAARAPHAGGRSRARPRRPSRRPRRSPAPAPTAPKPYGGASTHASSPSGPAATSARPNPMVLNGAGPPPSAGERRQPGVRDGVRPGAHLGVVAGRVLVDERDARPRQDVVELVQEQELPQLGQPPARMLGAGHARARARPGDRRRAGPARPRRLPRLTAAWVVYVPRWYSK